MSRADNPAAKSNHKSFFFFFPSSHTGFLTSNYKYSSYVVHLAGHVFKHSEALCSLM